MARKPQVRYFPSRGAFFCQIDGRQCKLAVGPDDSPNGPTYLAALQAFTDLLGLKDAPTARDHNTVRLVLEHYLRYVEASERSPATLELRRHFCAAFCNDGHGETTVAQLTPFMVTTFLAEKRRPRQRRSEERGRPWSLGTVRCCIASLNAAFAWAVRAELCDSNPIATVERPGPRSRGREAILTPDQHRTVLKHASRCLHPYAVVLEATGARPGEISAATAADLDRTLGALVYHAEENRGEGEFRHKTAGKGRDRRIFLTGEALALLLQLADRYPTGPLLRTRRGARWSRPSVCRAFWDLREPTGLPHLTAYSYRHTFATRWLLAGKSVDVLAELLGNSAAVIRRHYSHLCSDTAALRSQVEEFRNGASA